MTSAGTMAADRDGKREARAWMDPASEEGEANERRSSGMLRVPFVRRCRLAFPDGRSVSAFIVNINVLGAYVARDDLRLEGDSAGEAGREAWPRLGEFLTCSFLIPESQSPMDIGGVVSWVNPRQQHPLHSLPPGFGLRFETLSDRDRETIEAVVEDYLVRTGHRP